MDGPRVRGLQVRLGAAAALAAVVGACGSQIDALDVPVVRPPSPAPAGIYGGTLSSVADDRTLAVTALVSPERIFAFDEDGELIASGRYETSGRDLNWQARGFQRREAPPAGDDGEAPGDTPAPGETVRRLAITATGGFDPEARILMSYAASVEGESDVIDSGNISWSYARAQYERRSDLPLVAGTWVNEDNFGTATASFSISEGGDLFGQDADGCNYSGRLSLIDQKFNLYGASLRIQCSGTPSPRLESGLATLRRAGTDEMLVIVTTSASSATLLRLNPG
ncbi:hypothetical protein ABSH63_07405 [Sinimarinibacterium sp. HSW-8]|uniref:META domain-containing protein n=1 Tax=Sinimarinibacterium thermocellulolyticum TaxID=3170016 RepID=A0ABV2A9L0_9GAMM